MATKLNKEQKIIKKLESDLRRAKDLIQELRVNLDTAEIKIGSLMSINTLVENEKIYYQERYYQAIDKINLLEDSWWERFKHYFAQYNAGHNDKN